MGLSSFPSAAEGVLPVLVMNTVLSVALLKNMIWSLLQIMGANWNPQDYNNNNNNNNNDNNQQDPLEFPQENARERRISITQFKSFSFSSNGNSGGGCAGGGATVVECCVCLCGFEAEEEVSELVYCKHFFHKRCLDKWFDNKHSTCPLCRSIL